MNRVRFMGLIALMIALMIVFVLLVVGAIEQLIRWVWN